MSFINELKRRNVFKVAAAYIIVGWLIMQAGEVLGPALHLPDWINSALAFFIILGFPLAIFFAWAFEMTPEGLKKERNVDRSQSITNVTGQKLNYSIIALLVVTLGYFAYDKFMLQPRTLESTDTLSGEIASEAEDTFQSIAVLPFVNMSDDSSNEYFSDGLTEELLNILSKIKDLRVAGRTSSFAFKGQNDDLRVIGEKLDVKSILEGSVRKDDQSKRVRITVQLINVEDGYHLWSETYDRELVDIFAIQDEIAHEVAQALRITLLGEDETRLEQVASTQINAYDVYLKGLQGLNLGGYVSLGDAANKFQQALALDPKYTPAKLGLVLSWSQLAQTGAITESEAIRKGLPLLEAILAEQADNSDAHVQLALLRDFENDPEKAEQAFTTALELNPRNAFGLQEFGRFLFDQGQIKRGMDLIDAAVEIEPYDVMVIWDQCQTNAIIQNIEAALSSCSRIRDIEPDSPLGYYGRANAHLHNGDLARTVRGFADAIKYDPDDYEMLSAMCQYWLMLGDVEQASLWQQRADAIGAGQPIPIQAQLMLYKYREQHQLALELAKQVIEQKLQDRFGSNAGFRQTLAYESARLGDYQTALAPYRDAFPWAFETPIQTPEQLDAALYDVIQIAGLLKLAEPISGHSTELLEIAKNHVDETPPGWGIWSTELRQAQIATIEGDKESAVNWLNKAWDKQWRFDWRQTLLEDAIITQLAGEPGYQELITRFEADMERQREEAYVLMDISR